MTEINSKKMGKTSEDWRVLVVTAKGDMEKHLYVLGEYQRINDVKWKSRGGQVELFKQGSKWILKGRNEFSVAYTAKAAKDSPHPPLSGWRNAYFDEETSLRLEPGVSLLCETISVTAEGDLAKKLGPKYFGQFRRLGNQYSNGRPVFVNSQGKYLFSDGGMMEGWGMWTLNDVKPEMWSYEEIWREGTDHDHEPIVEHEWQQPSVSWAVLARAGLCPSQEDEEDVGVGSLMGGLTVRRRLGCWRTVQRCVNTKLKIVCSHHGRGREEERGKPNVVQVMTNQDWNSVGKNRSRKGGKSGFKV